MLASSPVKPVAYLVQWHHSHHLIPLQVNHPHGDPPVLLGFEWENLRLSPRTAMLATTRAETTTTYQDALHLHAVSAVRYGMEGR